MSFDIKQLRRDVDGFNGRFFYDAERGDIGYIAKDCDEGQCDCGPNYNADGDQDCSVSLFDDTGEVDGVGEPIARMLNALPAALARIEELERALEELLEAGGAFDEIADRDDNDPELTAAGVRVIAAQLTAASLLAARKDGE